ncbi:hypothetical protein BC826DRAFT_1189767 [Russula brevipes]|nr:hypothetical protein BC826DRAFT_1189767 [Russula brevipes]
MLAHLASYKPPVDEADEAGFPHDDFNDRSPPELCNPLETADPQPNTPQPDVVRGAAISEFRVEYHPRSQKHVKPEVYRSEEYHSAYQPSPQPPRGDSNPWGPFFNTREDFLVAELLLEAGMNKEQSERLIKIIGRCVSGKGTFTLARYADIESAWERASINLTPFEKSVVSVKYKDKEMSYDVHHRSLWDWATDLVQDPLLAPHFHWDAEKVFRCLGDQTTRVFDEPWTADAFWDIQSQIPEGGSPLSFIIYADKTKLSSFGTAKGYPVIARCANLPTSIRNGNGLGGGRVVGWLPIVSEDPKESKKPLFVNFKRAVWHESLHIVLQSIIRHSKSGCWLQCADGAQRWIFPNILILSADYEEQCVMSLIRGSTSKRPCPVCLVKAEDLADITKTWPFRTADHTQDIIQQARALHSANEREKLLSENGIRNVDIALKQQWFVGHHLWEQFKTLITSYGRSQMAQIDTQFNAVPRWSGLIHFSEVMKVSFTDGAKFEDMSKLIVFVALNVIQRNDKEGWALLRSLRSYSIVDLYLALEVHTENTIQSGRRELAKFALCIQEYVNASTNASEDEPVKKWSFPKMHALVHSFDDIEKKGASRNYNTKPNEKLHGPLKKAYLTTNFKNVAPQILKVDHHKFISSFIHSQIDEMDANNSTEEVVEVLSSSQPPSSISQAPLQSKVFKDGHVSLHSQQLPTKFASLDDSFRTSLASWLTTELAANNVPLPSPVKFSPGDQITEYQTIKIVYESKVDLKQYIDLIHCSPRFHNQERRDFVIIQTISGPIFARLLKVFLCSIANTSYPICFVQPLDAPISTPPVKDRDLQLHRVRAKSKSEFIFTQSIIRGAPLIEDFNKPGDFLVMDVVDHTGDLFLRCNEMYLHR